MGPRIAQRLVKRRADSYYIGGRNLREHRKAIGISQRQLAGTLNFYTGIDIDHRRISEWERSFEFAVNRITVVALKKILKIS